VRSQKTLTYRLSPDASFSAKDLSFFLGSRCVIVLLSAELVRCFCQPALLPLLQRAFHPPQRVVRLLCGVQDGPEFLDYFPDWAHWQELTCDDEPETYVAAVKKAISEDSGCDSVTDTETEDEKVPSYLKQQNLPLQTSPGTLMVVQPDRIRCGVGTRGAGESAAGYGLFNGCICCSKGSVISAFPWGFHCRLAALGIPVPGP